MTVLKGNSSQGRAKREAGHLGNGAKPLEALNASGCSHVVLSHSLMPKQEVGSVIEKHSFLGIWKYKHVIKEDWEV